MKCSLRRLDDSEIDYERRVWFISITLLAVGAGWLALALPLPTCLFHAVTGHPCATCGATRAAVAFFQGRFLESWKWNPLAFLSYCLLVPFNLYAVAAMVTHAPRLRIVKIATAEKMLLGAAVLMLVFANWIYLLNSPALR